MLKRSGANALATGFSAAGNVAGPGIPAAGDVADHSATIAAIQRGAIRSRASPIRGFPLSLPRNSGGWNGAGPNRLGRRLLRPLPRPSRRLPDLPQLLFDHPHKLLEFDRFGDVGLPSLVALAGCGFDI